MLYICRTVVLADYLLVVVNQNPGSWRPPPAGDTGVSAFTAGRAELAHFL